MGPRRQLYNAVLALKHARKELPTDGGTEAHAIHSQLEPSDPLCLICCQVCICWLQRRPTPVVFNSYPLLAYHSTLGDDEKKIGPTQYALNARSWVPLTILSSSANHDPIPE